MIKADIIEFQELVSLIKSNNIKELQVVDSLPVLDTYTLKIDNEYYVTVIL